MLLTFVFGRNDLDAIRWFIGSEWQLWARWAILIQEIEIIRKIFAMVCQRDDSWDEIAPNASHHALK